MGKWVMETMASGGYAGLVFLMFAQNVFQPIPSQVGLRSLISIPAGIARMNFPLFLACTVVGSALWTAALAWVGYLLGSNFDKVESYLDPVTWLVFTAIGLVYIVRVIRGAGASRAA